MKVNLTWNSAQNGIFRNADGYYVFRSEVSGGPYSLLETVPVSSAGPSNQTISTIDQPGIGTWFYVVQAFRNHPKALSQYTNEFAITVTNIFTISNALASTPPSNGLIQTAVAGPNISNGQSPIRIFLNLNKPAKVTLSIFALTGEQLFHTEIEADAGSNTLIWDVKNNVQSTVASGLYLYVLRVNDGLTQEIRKGKIAIIH